MAMELARAAMTPLIKKLGELLVSELTLEKRVRQDIFSLYRELELMQVKLGEVAEVPPDQLDTGTKLWARNVRELSYDMEDAVDAFTLRVEDAVAAGLRSRLRGFLDRTARLFSKGKALHQVAGAVRDAKSLSKELGDLHQRYDRIKLQDTSAGDASSSIDPRVTAMYTDAADLVGVDEAWVELIKVLSDPSEVNVKTVSIVGFGGLRKTTLARAVYDKIKLQFDCRAFVSVSRNPDITRIFKKILHQLDKEKYANINEAVRDIDQLIDELKGFLQNKRYLIVIDDLWEETNWKLFKCAFPKNACSSRLITTTRKHNVSDVSCSSDGDKIYKMKPLSEDDSQRLFHSRIFHCGDGCPPELEQVSKDILKKCGGVPLAIITIAGLLASHKKVKGKDQWLILLNSIGHGLKGCWSVVDMHKILSFSYYDLPSHLKPCLLYLSIFPEDYEIERERLIWRWIAEGFIQHGNSGYNNQFEIGENYFVELVNRSMIQPVHINFEDRARACRVHDMVLDLIRSLSREENFVTIWDNEDDEQSTSAHNSIIARRLSIIQNTTRRPQATTTSMSKVRSFTIFNPAMDSMPSLSEFQVMRVLDLEDCDLSKCGGHLNLKHVGKLAHLRYLGLRNTCIREVPVEVGKLQFLETLDVSGSTDMQELPKTITGLRKLMCLHLAWDTRLPNGLGNLTSLEVLTGIWIYSDDSAVVKELGRLTRLRVLHAISEAADVAEDLVQSLGNLSKFQSLDLSVPGESCKIMRDWAPPPRLRRFSCTGLTCALPTWMKNSLSSLTFLDIEVYQVGPDDLQALGALRSLHRVLLRAVAGCMDQPLERTNAAVHAGAFPCARACTFMNFATVPSMFASGAMPLVQYLRFSFRAWDITGDGGEFGLDDLRMGHLPSLRKVLVDLWCREEDDDAVAEQVEAALHAAAEDHPNRLAMSIYRRISPRPA